MVLVIDGGMIIMIIKHLDFEDHGGKFWGGGYVMSFVAQKELNICLPRLETKDGHVGWGEIVRKATFDSVRVASEEEPLLEGNYHFLTEQLLLYGP